MDYFNFSSNETRLWVLVSRHLKKSYPAIGEKQRNSILFIQLLQFYRSSHQPVSISIFLIIFNKNDNMRPINVCMYV